MTTSNIYDYSAIMGRAWAIRRSAAAEMGCKVSDVVMGECLRMAWAEAEGPRAGVNASKCAKAWAAMSGEAQVVMMKKCIHKAARQIIGYSTEDHYLQYTEVPAFGLYGAHDLDEFVNETWERVEKKLADLDALAAVNERRASQHKRPRTLVSIVTNAAKASISAVYYADSKHSVASDFETENDNGERESYIQTAVDPACNVEESATLAADLEAFKATRDEIDRTIIDNLMEGKTENEIGAIVGISGPGVHYRIKKIRAALKVA